MSSVTSTRLAAVPPIKRTQRVEKSGGSAGNSTARVTSGRSAGTTYAPEAPQPGERSRPTPSTHSGPRDRIELAGSPDCVFVAERERRSRRDEAALVAPGQGRVHRRPLSRAHYRRGGHRRPFV